MQHGVLKRHAPVLKSGERDERRQKRKGVADYRAQEPSLHTSKPASRSCARNARGSRVVPAPRKWEKKRRKKRKKMGKARVVESATITIQMPYAVWSANSRPSFPRFCPVASA